MGKIIIAVYRLPSHVKIHEDNEDFTITPMDLNASVLASSTQALRSEGKEILWIGAVTASPTTQIKDKVREKLKEHNSAPVFIDPEVAKGHFNIFCKGVVWPLFHYIGAGATFFSQDAWRCYQEANKLFAEEIARNYVEGDLIMIQDYHLMLTPSFVRQKLPASRISFFMHIPWPTSELYRSLPVRDHVLQGLLGADLIGFQTFPYARHFLSAISRVSGYSCSEKGIELPNGHFVRVEVEPVGIDSLCFESMCETEEVKRKITDLQSRYSGTKIIVARDAMEYIQGIPHKLKMFDEFLETYPDWKGKVTLYQECVPNTEIRADKEYRNLCTTIEKLVGSINGKYSKVGYTPIVYLNRPLPFADLCSILAVADAGLVTALRDGMNTTAFEFVACQKDKKSPLVLSEFAGSANCLSGSMMVNPWDQKKCIETLHEALTMSEEYKNIRYEHNRDYVFTHHSTFWLKNCVKTLEQTNRDPVVSQIQRMSVHSLLQAYRTSKRRLILLDYDGTLTPIVKVPSLAIPTEELVSVLTSLGQNPKNVTYVITGRERRVMDEWLGGIPIGMSCEHGSFFRPFKLNDTTPWQNCTSELDLSWKGAVTAILEDYADRTPGSFVETKEINVSWHYRNSEPEFAEYQTKDLIQHLQDLPNLPVDILPGKKVVEVRPQGISKGSVVRKILNQEIADGVDFILCIGDDKTDEEMFEEVNKKEEVKNRFTITVEKKPSVATYFSDNQRHIIDMLTKLAYS